MAEPVELERWFAALASALEIEVTDIDVQALLDVARDAAHGVTRPAAPLATFLVGWAAATGGGDRAALERACATASALAKDWQ